MLLCPIIYATHSSPDPWLTLLHSGTWTRWNKYNLDSSKKLTLSTFPPVLISTVWQLPIFYCIAGCYGEQIYIQSSFLSAVYCLSTTRVPATPVCFACVPTVALDTPMVDLWLRLKRLLKAGNGDANNDVQIRPCPCPEPSAPEGAGSTPNSRNNDKMKAIIFLSSTRAGPSYYGMGSWGDK